MVNIFLKIGVYQKLTDNQTERLVEKLIEKH